MVEDGDVHLVHIGLLYDVVHHLKFCFYDY